jgi:mRNA-degrading endonuclease RelE of RelBE toxin-antitoxin system
MDNGKTYEIRVTPEAARQIRKLSRVERKRLDDALRRLASQSASSGSRGGKSLKQIHGLRDRFFRLRVGDLRVMFDLHRKDQVLLVVAVVNRRDLERWLRTR